MALRSDEGLHMKALIIEGNLDLAELFSELLTHCGHEVQIASEPQAALATARSEKPEIIFLDMGLPSPDGYILARQLRNEPAIDGVKIVALSCCMLDGKRFKDSGIDSFLLKPVAMKTLMEMVAG